MLPTIGEVEERLLAAAPGARFVLERLLDEVPDPQDEVAARLAADLDLRRRLSSGFRAAPSPGARHRGSVGRATARWSAAGVSETT